MEPRARRAALTLLATAIAALALWSAPIVAMDPYGVFRKLGVPTTSWPERIWTRVAAGERIADRRCDTILLGTSQVMFMYGGPPFAIGDEVLCNGALSGGTMFEVEHATRLLVDVGRARRVVLFLDMLMFHDARGLREDFAMSRLNEDRTSLAYHAWAATSWDAFVEAAHARGVTAPWLPNDHPRPTAFVATHVWTKVFLNRPDLFRTFRSTDASFAALDRTLDRLARAGIEVLVVIPPMHAVHHENVRTAGLDPLYATWKTRLAAVIAARQPTIRAWDFQRYHDPATSPIPFERGAPVNPWWFDAVHPSMVMGRAILQRIGDDLRGIDGDWDDDFGAPFTPATVAEDLASRRDARAAWMAQHPDQVTSYRRMLGDVLANDPTAEADWDANAAWFGQTVERLSPLPPKVPASP